MNRLRIKRIYEAPSPDDGQRVLVDRLWPRGVSKERAKLSEWYKDIAPSSELRKWFGHDPVHWLEFQIRYRHELEANPVAVAHMCALRSKGDLTLLYAALDPVINHTGVLLDYLHAQCR